MSDERDYYSEGQDAYYAGHGDTPPADVPPGEPESEWITGYEGAEIDDNEGEHDDDEEES